MSERWSTETEELVAQTIRDSNTSGSWNHPQLVPAGHYARAVLTALADAGLLVPPAEPCSCGGRRWVDDENWSMSTGTNRRRGDGLIPCGFCNHGGWNVNEWEVP